MKLKVVLNGTDKNPYHLLGLKQNPFNQIADRKYDAFIQIVQSLAADPIPHSTYEDYIRNKLDGFSSEFVDLCVMKFKPGQMAEFVVEFND